jgi:hypothetical protein
MHPATFGCATPFLTTAKDLAQIPQESAQPLGLLGGGRSDGRASRDVLSGLVQRDVQIFGGCAVEPQNDVVRHAQTLIARRATPVRQGRLCGSAADNARWRLRDSSPHETGWAGSASGSVVGTAYRLPRR